MSDSKYKKLTTILGIGVAVIILAVVFGTMQYNKGTEPSITVDSGVLKVSGTFGVEQPLGGIKDISLKDEAPVVITRTNGLGLGDIDRGSFKVEGLGEGKLYVHLNQKPFIYIMTDGSYIIINYKDSEKTKALYTELISKWKPK